MIKILEKDKKDKFLYICQRDDTLESIMDKFNLTKEEFLYDNPLFSSVYEGCMLLISGIDRKKIIVKPLQTLFDIAKEYNMTVEDLISMNNLKSDKVFVGMQLIIK